MQEHWQRRAIGHNEFAKQHGPYHSVIRLWAMCRNLNIRIIVKKKGTSFKGLDDGQRSALLFSACFEPGGGW